MPTPLEHLIVSLIGLTIIFGMIGYLIWLGRKSPKPVSEQEAQETWELNNYEEIDYKDYNEKEKE